MIIFMALFYLSPNRLLNTADIADAQYTPTRSYMAGSESIGMHPFTDSSKLEIKFIDGTALALDSEAADAAWAAVQVAVSSEPQR
jgi:hypothetical protein